MDTSNSPRDSDKHSVLDEQSSHIRVVSDARFSVGESPLWHPDESSLIFVDIIDKALVTMDQQGHCTRVPTQDFPTACALVEQSSSHLIVAFAQGVSLVDRRSGKVTPVCQPDQMQGNRLNEGKCDPKGRFWVSSMQTNLHPDGSGKAMGRESGALFSVLGDGFAKRWTEYHIGLTNTMAWSPNRETFYFGDSMNNVIWAYDYELDTGSVSNPRVFFEHYLNGVPDGSCIDSEGYLWNCRFGGAEIIRIAPDGLLDSVVRLPVTNPTSCTFGGERAETLYITSAQFTLTPEQLKQNPMEGAVLSFKPHVGGAYEYPFACADNLLSQLHL
ncbi:SMP-30/gluconolactonase/LRE family protein [Vibrio sp. S9_S30]|uniref:SMP-30/gluconolactonase/LRE family protein n=1 Tax=Vibrio sp. S9_S30 TaxID=2720226 RepID=UPI0016814B0E|nr:SMP-30/gluconolactonase/LRE family protein [Vibrio sp. S9_S30]MBD1557565.1 SMP-30/gluconolactonase/LRE family protein [Vibrio sp. S9_S30]